MLPEIQELQGQLPMKCHQHLRCLREFRTGVRELVQHEIIKKQKLKGPDPVIAVPAPFMRSMKGASGCYVDPTIMSDLVRVEQILVKDFVRVLRFFRMHKEPSGLNNVIKVIQALDSPDLLRKVRSIKKYFEHSPSPHKMHATINGQEIELDETAAHDLFENGEVMHSSIGKRETFLAIDSSGLSDFAYSLLMRNLITQSNAVISLYLVLRDHGVIQEIEDEPEWLR